MGSDASNVENPSPDSAEPADGKQEFGQLIDTCRQYLLMVANSQVDANLRCKFGASDIVQETLITAHQEVRSFSGGSEEELRLWLRRILLNKLANARRRFVHNAKREIAREVPISGNSSHAQGPSFVDPSPTPRQKVLTDEMHSTVRQAIGRLTPHDQELIKLRSFELKSFAEIGEELQTTSEAARKAWCRAIDRFRLAWRQINQQD